MGSGGDHEGGDEGCEEGEEWRGERGERREAFFQPVNEGKCEGEDSENGLDEAHAKGLATVGIVIEEKAGLAEIATAEMVAVVEVAFGDGLELGQGLLDEGGEEEPGGEGEGEEESGEWGD